MLRPARSDSYESLSRLSANLLYQLDTELFGRVAAEHASNGRFVDIGLCEGLDSIPRTSGVLVRIAGAPDDFFRELMWQPLDQTLLGIKT